MMLDKVIAGYCQQLSFNLIRREPVSKSLALHWQAPSLQGCDMAILAADNGDAWLRVIEDKQVTAASPLKCHGWMSLETNVGDVDAIRANINDEYFQVIGEPAYLQLSDAIKAMQVIGPANEVSYLTQVEAEVAGFELPMSDAKSGSLFIPVLSTPNRMASLAFYQSLNLADPGLVFNTKVTVLNRAFGHDIEHQFPLATLQLAGKCLFEIDEVTQASAKPHFAGHLPAGIALVSCYCTDIDKVAAQFKLTVSQIDDPYYQGKRSIVLTGPAGELLELIGD